MTSLLEHERLEVADVQRVGDVGNGRRVHVDVHGAHSARVSTRIARTQYAAHIANILIPIDSNTD